MCAKLFLLVLPTHIYLFDSKDKNAICVFGYIMQTFPESDKTAAWPGAAKGPDTGAPTAPSAARLGGG